MGGSSSRRPLPDHFVVLLSYEGRFGDPTQVPRCWIFPHAEIEPLVKTAGTGGKMRYLSRKLVLTNFPDREGDWSLLAEPARAASE